jgi:CelD/BcsL family acetyltransferase involved in cellulose biosynthesis
MKSNDRALYQDIGIIPQMSVLRYIWAAHDKKTLSCVMVYLAAGAMDHVQASYDLLDREKCVYRAPLSNPKPRTGCDSVVVLAIDGDGALNRALSWLEVISRGDRHSTLFQSTFWISSVIGAAIKNGSADDIRIIFSFENGKPIAALPVRLLRVCGIRIALALGDPLSQYSDLAQDGDYAPDVQFIVSQSAAIGVDLIIMRRVREDANIMASSSDLRRIVFNHSTAPFLDLAQFKDGTSFRKWSGKKQRERDRLRRRASSKGELRIEIAKDPSRAVELALEGIRMKVQWLKHHRVTNNAFSAERNVNALLSAVASRDADGGAVVSAALLNGEVAAVEIGFIHKSVYSAFLGVFDFRHRDWSPTKLLTEALVEWCIVHGTRRYDLLPPSDSYKREWTNDACRVSDWIVPTSFAGRLIAPAVPLAVAVAKGFLRIRSNALAKVSGGIIAESR